MPRPQRWAYIVLGLSLLANLFLAGVVTGRWWDRPPAGVRSAPRVGVGLGGRARLLAPGDRRRFGEVFRTHRPAIREARLAVQAAAQRSREAIGAEPYDRAHVDAALAEVRTATAALQAAQQAALSAALAQISPAGRAIIAAPPPAPAATMR